MSPPGSQNAPEDRARMKTDVQLAASRWLLQDYDDMNLAAARAIEVREFRMKSKHGYVDYLLFIDGQAIGTIEAKPAGYPTRRLAGSRRSPSSTTRVTPTRRHTYSRPDFWTTTSNKQLNFVQHVKSMLKVYGRAAVVFAQGVKANVLFFDRKPGTAAPWTKKVWAYDLRTNMNFTLMQRRMVCADLDDFVTCYRPGDRNKRDATWSEANPEGRWRVFTYGELIARDKCCLDIFWLKADSLEDSANLPQPHVLAAEIAEDLGSA